MLITCYKINSRENSEKEERENSVIDILKGIIHEASKGLFIVKG